MWQILPLEIIISFFVVIGLLSFAGVWLFSGAPHFWRRKTNKLAGVPRMISLATTLTVVLTVITGKYLWSPISKIPGFEKNIYADINGTWTGEIKSNWVDPKTGKKADPIPLEANIKQNFFKLEMHLTSQFRYTESHTVVAMPESNSQLGVHRLWYLFTSHVKAPQPDDSSKHEGAAVLDLVYEGGELELQGTYWTNRNWWKNKQTAGSIVLRRANR